MYDTYIENLIRSKIVWKAAFMASIVVNVLPEWRHEPSWSSNITTGRRCHQSGIVTFS